MNKSYYYEYLKSPQWESKRIQLFIKRGKKCEKCGSCRDIQVHHLTYERIFQERDEDLKILCGKCHASVHNKKRSAKKIIKNKSKKESALTKRAKNKSFKKERRRNLLEYEAERFKKMGY